jgi:hypothetical protein
VGTLDPHATMNPAASTTGARPLRTITLLLSCDGETRPERVVLQRSFGVSDPASATDQGSASR